MSTMPRGMTAFSLRPLAGQVMLITGASSGIGLVTARRAAKRGARVMLVARNEPALAQIVAQIVEAGGTAAYAVADVGVIDEVRAAARLAVERFGRIDTWVNCAGVAIYAKLGDTPEEEHRRLFQTNYFGMVHGALTAVEHLRTEGGALITIGSIAGDFPSPIMGAYAASKHAVKGYIESLRIELADEGAPISVTLIKPSGIDTPIAEHAANHTAGGAKVPPPVYDPELVASAILDAAVNRRRNVTVGGLGRLEVMFATHFPGLYAHLGKAVTPLFSAQHRPKVPGSNLAEAGFGGNERSRYDSGRRFSVHAPASRHPSFAAAAAASGAALLTVWLRQRGGSQAKSEVGPWNPRLRRLFFKSSKLLRLGQLHG
jgi:short-subunit dehydrogenase